MRFLRERGDIMSFLELVTVVVGIIYIVAAWKANSYLSYHLLGIEATYITNYGVYITKKFILACFLGVFTIPIAIIHALITNR